MGYSEESAGTTSSCGKRCTCNFQYQSRDTQITVGSTQYGMCFDNAAGSYYCALKEDHCASSEIFYNPHSGAMSGTDCNCDDVHLGGCMDGASFSHCAVAVDNCHSGQTHLAPRALRETVPDVDCRLCRNSWDENPPVAAPRSVPVAVPVAVPVTAPVAAPVEEPVEEPVEIKALETDDEDKSSDDDNAGVDSFQSYVIAVVTLSLFNLFLS